MSPLVIGALILGAVILVAYGFMSGSGRERDAVKRRLAGGRGKDETAELKEKARESASEDLARRAMPMLSKITLPTSEVEQTNLRAKLASAGLRKPQAQAIFLASKTIVAVALALSTLLGGWAYGLSGMMLIGAVLCAAPIGFLFPDIWLMLATSTRKEAIRHGLPDTLDLMVVSVAASV